MKKTRVLLLDDHTMLRQGIARLLNNEPDMEMNLHCASVGEALVVVASGLADIVLLDIDLGTERGTDFLAQARRNGFQGPVLVLTAGISEQEKELVRSYGVAGILRKDATVEKVAEHIREAMGTPAPVYAAAPSRPEAAKQFTARESTVLRLVVEGLANKEIAAELDVSESVIKAVLQQLFRKTGTHTRSQLVRVALESHREML